MATEDKNKRYHPMAFDTMKWFVAGLVKEILYLQRYNIVLDYEKQEEVGCDQYKYEEIEDLKEGDLIKVSNGFDNGEDWFLAPVLKIIEPEHGEGYFTARLRLGKAIAYTYDLRPA